MAKLVKARLIQSFASGQNVPRTFNDNARKGQSIFQLIADSWSASKAYALGSGNFGATGSSAAGNVIICGVGLKSGYDSASMVGAKGAILIDGIKINSSAAMTGTNATFNLVVLRKRENYTSGSSAVNFPKTTTTRRITDSNVTGKSTAVVYDKTFYFRAIDADAAVTGSIQEALLRKPIVLKGGDLLALETSTAIAAGTGSAAMNIEVSFTKLEPGSRLTAL